MIPLFQIPRNSLLWLLAAQILLIAPHLPRLPVWILLAWFTVVVWRIQIFRGRWPFPNRWVKALLVVVCVAGLFSEYGRLFGLEPMIGVLVTAFLLKLLEMRQKRDALIVVFLGYFIAATQFLFSPTLVATLYVGLTLVILTTALLGLHQSAGHLYPWRSFKLSGTLVLQSLPLVVVLFIVMPRLGSLWAVPQQEHAAKTGVSDSMSPGDFSDLVQDDSTAFRVTFKPGTSLPPPQALYWRGLVLSEFDGRRWSQPRFNNYRDEAVNWTTEDPESWRRLIETAGRPLVYDVILEPTQQAWLYALPTPVPRDATVGLTRDYRLIRRQPVRNRYQYEVESYPDYTIAREELSSRIRRQETVLPDDVNPRSREQAEAWMAEADGSRAYIERVLGYFSREFSYTLEPPALGQHPVDEFLWQSKRGFCEHFASAFVVMMRAAGLPARVVVGYQGGELNPLKNFLVVKQTDAHAWSEVWLQGEGWVRFDPTAAVAPGRIESGLNSVLNESDSELLDGTLNNGSRLRLFTAISLRLAVLEYDWHRWVMAYDQDKQSSFLRELLGAASSLRIAALLLGTGMLVLTLVGGSLLLSGRKFINDPGDVLYQRFLRILKRRGIKRQPGEGPRALASRVGEQRPELGDWVRRVTGCYERYAYAGEAEALAGLKSAIKESRQSTVYSKSGVSSRESTVDRRL